MRACLFAIAAISSMGASSAFHSNRNSASAPPSFLLSIRGGANEYEAKFEGIKASVVEKAANKVRFWNLSRLLCALLLLSALAHILYE